MSVMLKLNRVLPTFLIFLLLLCCKPNQRNDLENYCKFIEKVVQNVKQDTSLIQYLPTPLEVKRQFTYLENCTYETKFFYAFKYKYDSLKRNKNTQEEEDWLKSTTIEIQRAYYHIQSKEKDKCFESNPLYQTFQESSTQHSFLKELYKKRGHFNFNLSDLEVEDCQDTTFFLYYMLDDMPLKYDASFGNIYLLNTEEEFYQKLKDKYQKLKYD